MKQYVVANFRDTGNLQIIDSSGGSLISESDRDSMKRLSGKTMAEVLNTLSNLGWVPLNFPFSLNNNVYVNTIFFEKDFPDKSEAK